MSQSTSTRRLLGEARRQLLRIGLLLAVLLVLKLDQNNAATRVGATPLNANNNEQLSRPANRLAAASWYLNNLRFRRQAPGASKRSVLSAGGAGESADGLGELQAQLANAAEASRRQQQQQQQAAASGGGLSQLPLLLQNQQLLEDEQTIRNQLPELIAQAHNDKTIERALLKMLINASLRSALSNMVSPSSAAAAASPLQQQLSGGANSLSWLDGLAASGGDGSGAIGERLARLEQQQQLQQQNELISDPMALANGDAASGLAAEGGQQYGQSANLMDKREYIKPCSFNAISCVRTPFRKL